MDNRWRQKIWQKSIQLGVSAESQQAALEHITKAAVAACKLVGRNQTAMLLLLSAEGMAEPGKAGRRSGSWGHGVAELRVMMNIIIMQEDGSPRGRTKAITSVLEGVPNERRPGLRQWLRRHLPALDAVKIRT
jgi:hypothetical protein